MSQGFTSAGVAKLHKGNAFNPTPYIASVSPSFVGAGTGNTTVAITGSGFLPSTTGTFAGNSRTVTYVSSTRVDIALLTADFDTGGFFDLILTNAPPGGGSSVPFHFQVVGANFTPANITTQLWFDAADAGTITIATGVSQMLDKSGNNRTIVQATGANQPLNNSVLLNSLPVLTFDGTDNLIGTANLTGLAQNIGALSVYVVRRFTDLGGSGFCVPLSISDGDAASSSAARYADYMSQSDDIERVGGQRLDADAFANQGTGVITVNTWAFFSGHLNYSAAQISAFRNGTSVLSPTAFQTSGSTSNTAPSAIAVGSFPEGSFDMIGDIAEIVVTHTIDTAQRQQLEGYLAWKWGLQANLPGGHPYQSFPP